MAKERTKTVFLCQQCGNETPKWEGRCNACGEWNSYMETHLRPSKTNRAWVGEEENEPQEVTSLQVTSEKRVALPFPEMNQVLGGGLVKGSVVLVAGEPGIGKSTLLLQAVAGVTSRDEKALYISGEESGQQVKLRARRLGIKGGGLYFLGETSVESVLRQAERLAPHLVVIDSIQTLYAEDIPSGSGTVAQVRECTRLLIQWGKARDVPILMAGHVTKDGAVAGPRVLEHMVDVVLYVEGDPSGSLRLVRSTKNRFGATNDVAVFQMGQDGLEEVPDPSLAFIGQRQAGAVGSTVTVTMEGARPLLAEVQALTTPTVFTTPRRTSTGGDFNRLVLVTAVLTKRIGLPLASQDIIVNVAGGLRIGEPAGDLSMALAIVSSVRDVPLVSSCVCLGEVGLSGELRQVPQLERRLSEAAKLGFSHAIVPRNLHERIPAVLGIQMIQAATLREAIQCAFRRLPRKNLDPPSGIDPSNRHPS